MYATNTTASSQSPRLRTRQLQAASQRRGQRSIDSTPSSSSSEDDADERIIVSPVIGSGAGGAGASRQPVSANYVPRRYGYGGVGAGGGSPGGAGSARAVSSSTPSASTAATTPATAGLRSVSAPQQHNTSENPFEPSSSSPRSTPTTPVLNNNYDDDNGASEWASRSPKDRIAFARKRSQSQSSLSRESPAVVAAVVGDVPALPTTRTQTQERERLVAASASAAAAAVAGVVRESPALAQERREREQREQRQQQRSLGRLPLGGGAAATIGLGLPPHNVNTAATAPLQIRPSKPSPSPPSRSADEEILQSPAVNDFKEPEEVVEPRPSYEGYDHILERYERPFSALPPPPSTSTSTSTAAERAVQALEPEVSIPDPAGGRVASDQYVYAPTPSRTSTGGDGGMMARRGYVGPPTPDVTVEMMDRSSGHRQQGFGTPEESEEDDDGKDDDYEDEEEARGKKTTTTGGRFARLSQGFGKLPYLSSSALPSRFSRTTPPNGAAVGFSDSPLWSKQHQPGAGLSEKTEQFADNVAAKIVDPKKSMDTPAKREKAARIERRRIREARKRKRRWWVCGGLALVVLIAVAIAVPVAIITGRNNTKSGSSHGGGSNSTTTGGGTSNVNATSAYTSPTSPLNPLALPLLGTSYYASKSGISITNGSVITGHDGSTLYNYVNGTLETFTYTNQWGGYWQFDPSNPLSGGGKAQSWTPAIDEEWVWGRDTIKGVNLGGWLVIEPFIVPSLFEENGGAVDEWTLCEVLAAKGPGVLESTLRYHYETFITEQDFAEIAGAGLNYVRIPLGFWAVETLDSEPFLEGVAWQYFVRALGWARKYGLRVLLDLHGLPGSQNGWNHSGKAGVVNWMYGVMGIANAQRTLDVLRSLAEFVSQPEYENVVTILSLVNEVQSQVVGVNALQTFYYQAYQTIREASGVGKGPIILGHEGFVGIAGWQDYLPGADRFAIDQHPYLAFLTPQNANTMEQNWKQVCGWGGGTNDSSTNFGITIAGEWSVAISDCGLWLDGVGSVPVYNQTVGSCVPLDDWRTWTPEYKSNISTLALASMDSLQNWIFWTWKIGNSTQLGYPSSPGWHYRLGLQQGWIPSDPRKAAGVCASVGVGGNQFAGTYPASATGGGDGQIATASIGSYSAWPPASLGPSPSYGSAQIALMPTYTQTGAPVTLTYAAVPTAAAVQPGGWANAQDTAKAWTAVAGCTYPDAWNATASSLLPTAVCTGGGSNKRAVEAVITARP